MQISLIISTYNWPRALDLVLKSVARQSRMPDEILIADDGSGAETAKLVASWSQLLPVPVVHLWQEDQGYRLARSRNRAIAASRGDYVILVDGDMVLDEHFIADHERAAGRGWFVQGCRILTTERGSAAILEQGRTDFDAFSAGLRRRHIAIRNAWLARLFTRNYLPMRRVKGCNQAFWRSDLIAVNGFEERMIGWGPEDKECAARLMNVGVRAKEVRFAALAVHLHHASRKQRGINPNDELLASTLTTRRTRCDVGLDQHLPEFSTGIPLSARPPWAA